MSIALANCTQYEAGFRAASDRMPIQWLDWAMEENFNTSTVISPASLFLMYAILHGIAKKSAQSRPVLSFILSGSPTADSECVQRYYTRWAAALGVDGRTLTVDNGIYLNHQPHPVHRLIAIRRFNGTVGELDYSESPERAVDIVNEEVASRTNNRFVDVIPHAVPDASTIGTSVAAFSAPWKYPFDVEVTALDNFYPLNGGAQQDVEMMRQAFSGIRYYEDAQLQLIGLPYRNSEAALYVVLPKERYGLHETLLTMWTTKHLGQLILASKIHKVAVTLPKFSVVTSASFGENDQRFFHKAIIEINEHGSGVNQSLPTVGVVHGFDRKLFEAFHSFAYFLVKRSVFGPQVLFSGVVTEFNNNN